MDVELSTQLSQAQHAGRGDRVARTREAIVASTLTLAMEGEVAPIVRDIAKLAGVSARTVFQHFADTAELYVAVLGRVLSTLASDPPAKGGTGDQGALDERITAAIGQRAGRYEKLVPMWTFVETLQRRSSEAGERVDQLYASNREQLAQSFGEELTALPGDSRERTLNAVAMTLTPESWIVLRERLGLTVEQAREEWRFIVKAIFKDTSR
jgi:AcrR family transcriptional regulator